MSSVVEVDTASCERITFFARVKFRSLKVSFHHSRSVDFTSAFSCQIANPTIPPIDAAKCLLARHLRNASVLLGYSQRPGAVWFFGARDE